MGGNKKPEGKKFDFKVKIVQTDLAGRNYLLGMGGGFGFDGDMSMFRHSGYVSKLWAINNYSGGILAKDRVEDMPGNYRRFVNFGNPSEKQMFDSFKRELAQASNREEIGQNIFCSQFSTPIPEVPQKEAGKKGAKKTANEKYAEIAGDFAAIASLGSLEDFEAFADEILYGGDDPEDGEYGEEDEEYDEYEDDEEIRDILQLNNVYNSELYKMSKVEYDFVAPGHISLEKDGMYTLEYDETEMTGVEGRTWILFGDKTRNIATFHRKGFSDDWFTLEKGKRVTIGRTGPAFNVVLATTAGELKNTITLAGGELRAVYRTEANGVPTETVSYSIKAKPAGGQEIQKQNIEKNRRNRNEKGVKK